MQPIGALIEGLPFNRDRIGEGDDCVLVRPRAPDLSIRYKFGPDLASIGQRAMIVNRDVGDANTLRHEGMLARPRQVKH